MGDLTDDQERVGARSRDEVRELLRRRRLSPKTIGSYLALLARVGAWCDTENLILEEIGVEDLERFASTLPQTRASLTMARSALTHYFAAIRRRHPPLLDLAERLGRGGRDPDEGLAALELARQMSAAQDPATTWRDAGYDAAWLRNRLVGRQLKRKTASTYVDVLRRVQSFCDSAGSSLETASAAELEAFATTLPEGRSSRQALRSALVHYYAAIRRPDPPIWGIRVPRKPRMLSRALDGKDALRLAAFAIERDDRMGLATIIGLYLGLRRFEIAKLRWADFDGEWLRLIGKGDVESTLPVHRVVQRYLERQHNDTAFVFPAPGTGGRQPVHPTTVWNWVRRVSVEAGFDAVPPHVLRHTALTIGNDATGDLRAVQDFARHAQVETTAGYTRATVERLHRVAEAIGDFYEGPSSSSGTSDPEPILPTLSFRELVALVEGAHAVDAWAHLAGSLSRRGWSLTGTLTGEGNLSLEFSPFLRARVNAAGPPPVTYVLIRFDDTHGDVDYENYQEWRSADIGELVAIARLLEQGLPVPPADSGATDDRYWIMEDA